MTPTQWERVKRATADALEREPSARAELIHATCADDPAVLHETLRLVAEAESAGDGFLSTPTLSLRNLLDAANRPPRFAPGQVVAGRFRIDSFINRGGMGEVYAAFDLELRERVALKTIRSSIASSPSVIERFKDEVKQTRRIAHPNVCRVYDLFAEEQPSGEPLWFLTMELLEGRTLAESIAEGAMPMDRALPLIREMVEALSAAHDMGIVHRDFKPGNVMLVGDGPAAERAVVMDFGLALSVSSSEDCKPGDGTPAYMAPEQASGSAAIGVTADQYAWGLVICEILTGKRLVFGHYTAPDARLQLSGWLRSTGHSIPPRAQRVIRRCLEHRPQDRFRSIRDCLPVLDGSRRRARIRLGAACVVGAVALAGVIFTMGAEWSDRIVNAVRVTPENDLAGYPNISRDGRWISYMSDRGEPGNPDIWIQPARGGIARRLTTDPAEDGEPSLSPDGRLVAFRSERKGGGLYVVASDGGGERLLAAGGRTPAFSPDGRRIAYWTGDWNEYTPSARIYVIPVAGGSPRRLAADFADARMPVWSSDGARLLFEGCPAPGTSLSVCSDWWVTPVGGGRPAPTGAVAAINAQKIEVQWPRQRAWWGDRVFFSGEQAGRIALWELPLSRRSWRVEGKPLQLTPGDVKEREPAVAADGTIAFGRRTSALHVWRIPTQPGGEPARVTHEPQTDCCPSVSPDGRGLFLTRKTADFRQIIRKDLSSGAESVLFESNEDKFWPIPDSTGRRIAFESRRGDRSWIGLIVDGRQTQLCSSCAHPASWFAGDRALFYTTAKGEIALLDARTGESKVTVTAAGGVTLTASDWNRSQQYLLFTAGGNGDARRVYAVHFPSAGTTPIGPWIPLTAERESADLPHWSPDGRAIFYLSDRDQHLCIWRRQFDARRQRVQGEPVAVMHYHDPRFTPQRTAPYVLGLSVAGDSAFLNIGEASISIWTGMFRESRMRSLFHRLFRLGY